MRHVLWFALLAVLALALATCTERRTQRPARAFDDPVEKKSDPAPAAKPKHGPHPHAHGAHPHKRDPHHHHMHPHPHVEGANGHHHPI